MLELYTDRLKVRSMNRDDWSDFLSIHQDPMINQFVRRPDDIDTLKEKFEHRLSPWSYSSGDWLSLVIEELETGHFIGFTGLYCKNLEFGHAEVGYMLATEGQGKGYATESLKAVIDWGSLSFNIHKFIALCAKDNIASTKVLERNGFQLEGILRDNYKVGQTWIDDCSYGLLTEDRTS